MKVEKPWGHEIRWAVNEKYIGKILHIKEGHRLSKQYHKVKDETVYVLEGKLYAFMGPKDIEIQIPEGHAYRIKPGEIHRFCAVIGDVTLVEVSTPEIEDVVRLEDDYSRDTPPLEETEEKELYEVYGGD